MTLRETVKWCLRRIFVAIRWFSPSIGLNAKRVETTGNTLNHSNVNQPETEAVPESGGDESQHSLKPDECGINADDRQIDQEQPDRVQNAPECADSNDEGRICLDPPFPPQDNSDARSNLQTKPHAHRRKTRGKRGVPANRPGRTGNPNVKSQPRCDLICMENAGQWAVAVSAPKGRDVNHVRQDGRDLSLDNGFYVLESIRCDVIVEFNDGESESILLVRETSILIFKTRKNWTGFGRKVKEVSDGHYIVFAHKTCGKRMGSAPVAPERCRYQGFKAHFFFSSSDGENDGFENQYSFYSPKKRFSLVGERVYDDADMGSLFVGDAPQLRDTNDWKSVTSIVVGREMGGAVIENFNPQEKTLSDVLRQQDSWNGWFFVRMYDDDNLMHSMDLRWVRNLQAICVNGDVGWQNTPIVPSATDGHSETVIEFKGNVQADCETSVYTRNVGDNTFAVTPHPNGDVTKWFLGNDEYRVESIVIAKSLANDRKRESEECGLAR